MTISRLETLSKLYECIEHALEGAKIIAVRGMECATLDQKQILFHLVVASYIVDTPEFEDLLSIKLRNKTNYFCLLCTSAKEYLQKYRVFQKYLTNLKNIS